MSVGIFCKSFQGDIKPLKILIESFLAHNAEEVSLTLSVPANDLTLINEALGNELPNVHTIADESYAETDLSQLPGWLSQQVCKLMSWRATDCKHYLVVDSDCYFIRDIKRQDISPAKGKQFIAFGSSLRTVLSEQNADLMQFILADNDDVARFALAPPLTERFDSLDKYLTYLRPDHDMYDAIQRSDIPFRAFGRRDWTYFQPGQAFSALLLSRLNQFFHGHGITATEAIRICPWEYNWYGEFAAAHYFEETEFRISPFLHFQNNNDVAYARSRSINSEILSRKFLLIQMAARHVTDMTL
jgi:hypothetical protein